MSQVVTVHHSSQTTVIFLDTYFLANSHVKLVEMLRIISCVFDLIDDEEIGFLML